MSAAPAVARLDDGAASTESKGSSAPLLNKDNPTFSKLDEAAEVGDGNSKTRKRDFWKLGKKQDEDKQKTKSTTPSSTSTSRPSASQIAPITGLRPASPMRSSDLVSGSASPHRSHPYASPGSPGQGMHSASPRPHSPASSMIFERNVQEDVVPPEMSPQIPSHVLTENHIPPALDASAEAITNEKLDPDSVEIITHATHLPAAVTITGGGAEHSMASSVHDDFSQVHRQDTDNASNYGSLDSTDVRRLSFISFADVVHAEQEHGDQRRDSAHLTGHPSLSAPRSPSPIRSPISSATFGTSPPTSVSASVKGLEASPNRGVRSPGSPLPGQSSPLGGELNIETMSQALRKTGSGDLSGFRSAPLSAVGNDDGTFDKSLR